MTLLGHRRALAPHAFPLRVGRSSSPQTRRRLCAGAAFAVPNVPHCRRLTLNGTKTERTGLRTTDGRPLPAQDASRAGAGREQPFPRVSTPAALALGHQSEDRKGESKDIPSPNGGEIKETGQGAPEQYFGSRVESQCRAHAREPEKSHGRPTSAWAAPEGGCRLSLHHANLQ